MHEGRKKGFLEELQSLDESTKNKIMIVTAIMIMAIVIYVWLGYFNNLIASVNQAPVAEDGASPSAPNGPGIGAILKNNAAFVYETFMNALRGLANILQAPRQYIIRPQN